MQRPRPPSAPPRAGQGLRRGRGGRPLRRRHLLVDALLYPENASPLVAAEVPGIDAILVGHAHVDIQQRYVTNKSTGKQVLLCEPGHWAMRSR